MNEPVDFAVVNGIKRLNRLTDGRVACCICFEFKTRDELTQDADGTVWDMCRPCAADEEYAERKRHEQDEDH